MAIKLILFNMEMVRAILDGRKSCTRRIIKVNTLITFRDFEIICTIPNEKYYKHRLEYDTEYEVIGNIFDNPELLESEG